MTTTTTKVNTISKPQTAKHRKNNSTQNSKKQKQTKTDKTETKQKQKKTENKHFNRNHRIEIIHDDNQDRDIEHKLGCSVVAVVVEGSVLIEK
eukprot:m.114546 g.114546  ORF g.114546 m.114546 type:complete len:93 (+) comp12822_c3_seq2:620-898(+)